MKKKSIKKLSIILLFVFMIFGINNASVWAADYPSYAGTTMDTLNRQGISYCKYKINVSNADNSTYDGKEIIIVPDSSTRRVKFVNPRTQEIQTLNGNEAVWADGQSIYFGDGSGENIYNAITSKGCAGIVGFQADDFGGLTVIDEITAQSEGFHSDSQVQILGDALTDQNRQELIEQAENNIGGEQTGKLVPTDQEGTKITETCEGILGEHVMDDIKDLLGYVRIIAPILVIVLGMVDFGKAVMNSDDKEMNKAISNLVKRLIAAVALFFIPIILSYLLDAASQVAEHVIDNCDMKGW